MSATLPKNLAKDLVDSFTQLRRDLATETLERSSPGKFIETVVQVLQYLDKGSYDKAPNVDSYLKNLESQSANLSDDLRITLSRVARAGYTLRNKRSIAHKGEVDPNIYDLKYLFSVSQWILSELVRQVLSSDMMTAGKIIEVIQIPVNPLVEDFGDKRLVLKAGTAENELLTLLFHYFPEYVHVSQIHIDMDRRAKSTVSNVIPSAYSKRYIEGNKQKGYKLTSLGYNKAFSGINAQE
ncbi:hypothetical protein ACFLWU_05340 [Chloroflexota bacterium]